MSTNNSKIDEPKFLATLRKLLEDNLDEFVCDGDLSAAGVQILDFFHGYRRRFGGDLIFQLRDAVENEDAENIALLLSAAAGLCRGQYVWGVYISAPVTNLMNISLHMYDQNSMQYDEKFRVSRYTEEPYLEYYAMFKDANPNEEPDLPRDPTSSQVWHMKDELEKYGFDPHLVDRASFGDPDAINELSRQIIDDLIAAKKSAERGDTTLVRRNKAIPGKLVDWLVGRMLDSLADTQGLPRAFRVLLRERTAGPTSEYDRTINAAEMRLKAVRVAAGLQERGVKLNYSLVAERLGVATTTVMRWFPGDDFDEQIREEFKKFIPYASTEQP